MKIKFLTVLTSLLTAAFMITSCLNDNNAEIEYSSEASITAFSIENIDTHYIDSVHYGKDTTITVTVVGEDYPFIINQLQRQIYNADSLPVGTDISKVVVNIKADTSWILISDQTSTENKDTVWTSTDSLNFEKPIQFKVVSFSGIYGAPYTVKLNVHKQVPDSLQWTCLGSVFDKTVSNQKAVTLGDKIYVFAAQEAGVALTTTPITDGRNWTPLHTLALPEGTDYSSAMVWGERIYLLAGNDLYSSADGEEWTQVNSATKLSRLIASVHTANNQNLYAVDTDQRFVESRDGMAWDVNGEVPAGFPDRSLSYGVSPLVTNSYIDRITLLGTNSLAADTTAGVWTRLTTEQRWEDYPADLSKNNYCPKLENLAMIYYNDRLYAFGGTGKKNGQDLPAFGNFYCSDDQGITWKPLSRYVCFPEEFTDLYSQANGNYSYTVDKNNFLWIIWSRSGQVWRGRINKLGFVRQE